MTLFSNFLRARSVLHLPRVGVLVASCALILHAQAPVVRRVSAWTPDVTRAELTNRLDSLQRVAPGVGSAKEQVNRSDETAVARARLANGDFQVGDRFLVETGITRDTVVIRDSLNISLLNWPAYSLRGVLRSELQPNLEKYVGTYVREPRVHTFPLTRLSITGGVGRPGFYNLEPSRPLSDAVMIAGGTGQVGQSDKISIFRGRSQILNEKKVAQAMRDGLTIDDLALQSGDEVRVAAAPRQNYRLPRYQLVLFGISAIGAILGLIRASYVP